MTVLKFKRTRHLKFRAGRIEAHQRKEKPMPKVYIGTVTLDDSAPNSLVIPALDLSAPVEVLQATIAECEAKRAAERLETSKHLREMFLGDETKLADVEPPEGKPPIARDILRP